MVCFAMNIVGDGAADGNEFGAGTDHWEPSFGGKGGDDLFEVGAGLAFEDALLLIPGKKEVHFGTDGNMAFFIEGLIAIAPAEAPCYEGRLLQSLFTIFFRTG